LPFTKLAAIFNRSALKKETGGNISFEHPPQPRYPEEQLIDSHLTLFKQAQRQLLRMPTEAKELLRVCVGRSNGRDGSFLFAAGCANHVCEDQARNIPCVTLSPGR
jgi:hypothetical protein